MLLHSGEYDLYIAEPRACEWDIAAGHAILKHAGGLITDFENKEILYGKKDFKNPSLILKRSNFTLMSEQLRIILIIIVSVSIFGLLVFVFVKNYIKSKINYYLNEKNKKIKVDLLFLNTHFFLNP